MTENPVRNEAADYLGQPGLQRALSGARTQVERLGRVGGTVVLSELSAPEASTLAGLLASLRRRDRPRSGRPFRLPARDLDRALRATRFGLTLPEALELVGPPLDPRPQRRARERAAAATAWKAALEHPLSRREPEVRAWVELLRDRGTLRRTADAEGMALLERALDLGQRLPSAAPIERTRLATELTGDPHALDDDRTLSRLMLAQLAVRAGVSRPAVALERRALWQRFGVTGDPASADVLTIGLRPQPLGPLARSLLLLSG
ncbi:MAG: TIGR02679 domain-containing protein, partial [Gaiellaceae bacterium]